MDGYQFNI